MIPQRLRMPAYSTMISATETHWSTLNENLYLFESDLVLLIFTLPWVRQASIIASLEIMVTGMEYSMTVMINNCRL